MKIKGCRKISEIFTGILVLTIFLISVMCHADLKSSRIRRFRDSTNNIISYPMIRVTVRSQAGFPLQGAKVIIWEKNDEKRKKEKQAGPGGLCVYDSKDFLGVGSLTIYQNGHPVLVGNETLTSTKEDRVTYVVLASADGFIQSSQETTLRTLEPVSEISFYLEPLRSFPTVQQKSTPLRQNNNSIRSQQPVSTERFTKLPHPKYFIYTLSYKAGMKSRPQNFFLSNGDFKLEMIHVRGGILETGKGDNKRTIQIAPFWMSKTEIPEHMFFEVLDDLRYEDIHIRPGNKKDYEKWPATVSWDLAMRFCRELKSKVTPSIEGEFSLPGRDEWEYACRAGKEITREDTLKYGWFEENSGKKFHNVGEKEANDWGFQDMLGNAVEWCLEISRRNPNVHVTRGGSSYYKATELFATSDGQAEIAGFRIIWRPGK